MPNGSEVNDWCVEFKVNKGLLQGSAFKWTLFKIVYEKGRMSVLY